MDSNNLRTRKCYKCNKYLDFDDFFHTNIQIYEKNELYRLWQSNYLELYCCQCYNEIYCETMLLTINSDKQIKFCQNCNVSLTFDEFRRFSSSYSESSLRLIIDHWKSSHYIFCSNECSQVYNKKVFLETFNKKVEAEVNKLVPEEKIFMEQLMMEITQIIKHVPKIDFYNNCFTVKEGRVISLFLSHTNMEILSESIVNLSLLRNLYLDNNKLKCLPISIGNLKFLKTLRLSGNNLKSLPNNMVNLRSLKELHLNNNRFINVPMVITKISSLKYLNLSKNPLNELPDSLVSLPHLKILYVMCIKNLKIPKSLKKLKRDKFMIVR